MILSKLLKRFITSHHNFCILEKEYDNSDLQRLYGKNYFEGRKNPPMWKRRAEFVLEKFSPNKTLDIGSSWGTLVEHLHDNGVAAYGIEGSDYAISQVSQKIKDRIFKVNLNSDKFPFENNTFDVITGFYVIEHIHNFEFFCSELHRTLKDDGVAWFLTPNEGEEGRSPTDVFTNRYENWKSIFEKNDFIVKKFNPYEMLTLKGKLKKFRFYSLPQPLQNIVKRIAYNFANSISMKDSSFIIKKNN